MTTRIHHLLDARRASPRDLALIDHDGTRHDYGQFCDAVERMADDLAARGLGPGDRLLIVAENCAALPALIIAASRLDAIAVPVNARMTEHELRRIAAHTQARLTVFLSGASPQAGGHAAAAGATPWATPLGTVQIAVPDPDATPEPVIPGADQVAVILYTTGSTGTPKGVMLSHGNLIFGGGTSARMRGMTRDDLILGVLPIAGALAAGTAMLPWRPAIAPIERPGSGVYSFATIERGRLAAAAGACNVCHVGANGMAFGGGRPLETPFGVVYASNISPDPAAGIGAWSYAAFARAMREGVSRDGHFLYPAHPYTSFAKAGEADIQALYAYLMTQRASPAVAPVTSLRFPFGIRSMMAGWNTLFLRAQRPEDPERGAEWNRGAELVEGLGHCSACHSPRNALGAERTGEPHLSGGFADDWYAPALNAASTSPVGWTWDAYYDYLRTGHSRDHGSAGGPMAQVIESFRDLPDADILAMATYLASLGSNTANVDASPVIAASEAALTHAELSEPLGARIFDGACASCHGGDLHLPHLALNSNLHAVSPNNVAQAIRNGVPAYARGAEDPVAMPAFGDILDPKAMESVIRYMRLRFAPTQPAWN